MPRHLPRYSPATPLLVLSLLIGLMSLPDVTNHLLGLMRPTVNAATNFTVNSTGDGADSNVADGVCNDGSGNCTLRAAIEQANAVAGSDNISFGIGSGVKSIVLTADLPMITDPVVIDGTTQPGFAGTPIIEINSNNRPNTNSSTLFITAGSSTVRGLVLNRSNNVAIALVTAGGNHIEGNFIGTDVSGSLRLPNSAGLIVNSSLNTVGGTTAGARNVISGNNGAGIEFNTGTGLDNVIEGNYIGVNAAGTAALENGSEGIRVTGSGNRIGGTAPGAGNVISGNGLSGLLVGGQMTTVQGNFIGTNAAGTAAIPNSDRGIRIFNSPNNVIGGTTPAARNLISGNFGAGITIEESGATGNVVQGNLIGTDVSGVAPLPNSPEGFGVPNTSGGVLINRGSNNLIGGSAAGAANTIAFNGGAGVWVLTLPNTNIGVGNHISRNAIYGNLRLGIDLGTAGVTPNDPGDSDTGANNLQNFPVITSVNTAGGSTTIRGTLGSAPNTNYELEFFANHGCHVSGNGEGARFLGTGTAATDANGDDAFEMTFQSALPGGQVVTATATDPSGNTSEFSPCSTNAATGLVQFGATTMSVREDLSTLTIPVNRVGGSSGPLTVNFATANNTAIAGQDYTPMSGTHTFADGETSKTISLPIVNDMVAENSETLFVTLSSPATPDVVGAMGVVVVRIWDPNSGTLLRVNDLSVTEGNSGTTNAIVTVSLSIAVGQTVTVHYQTFEMTATSGIDFQPVSGNLTFAPGITSQTIAVPIIGDLVDEPDETFRIGLSNAVNAAISVGSNPPVVLILDDDPVAGISNVTINDVSVLEGNSGTTNAIFTVSLSIISSSTVTVNFATANNTATASSDYQATSGVLTFNPGDASKTITVGVNGDPSLETNETFFVNLSSPSNATIADNQGMGTILNDDTPGFQFEQASYSVSETGPNVSIAVKRTGDPSIAATVDYATNDFNYAASDLLPAKCETASSNASSKCDYATAGGRLRFAAGDTDKTIVLSIVDDVYIEGDETLSMTLSNQSTGNLVSPSTTNITIQSNDTSPPSSGGNPYLINAFFVRQQYLDFLLREPDSAGFNDWLNVLNTCQPNQGGLGSDPGCDRVHVSSGFFRSPEFGERGYWVYRFFSASLGRRPLFAEFTPQMRRLSGLKPQADLDADEADFINEFMQRPEFTTIYSGVTDAAHASEFISRLEQKAGVTLPATVPPTQPGQPPQYNRQDLINLMQNGTLTPAQTLRAFVEQKVVWDAYFFKAFVAMEYFGYLRRDPENAGYDDWVDVLTNGRPSAGISPGDFRHLVFGFVYSEEYRERFGPK